MAVNYRMGRRGAPLTRLNAQPRTKVKVWKPLGEPTPPIPPFTFTLSADNDLFPADLQDTPDWFENADFTLTTSGGAVIDFVWMTDHWETTDTFPSKNGVGTVAQGENATAAKFFNATAPASYILAALGIRITAAGGTLITWTGA